MVSDMPKDVNTSGNENQREQWRFNSLYSYYSSRPVFKEFSEFELASILRTEFYGTIEIKNKADKRHGKKVTVPIFTNATLVKLMRKSPSSLVKYCSDGTIPEALFYAKSFSRKSPLYTFDQVKVFANLVYLLTFTDVRGLKYSSFSKELHAAWSKMPDGVVVQAK